MKIDFKVDDTRIYKVHIGDKVRCEEVSDWSAVLTLLPVFWFWKTRRCQWTLEEPCTYIWGINVKFFIWNFALISGQYKRKYNGPWEVPAKK